MNQRAERNGAVLGRRHRHVSVSRQEDLILVAAAFEWPEAAQKLCADNMKLPQIAVCPDAGVTSVRSRSALRTRNTVLQSRSFRNRPARQVLPQARRWQWSFAAAPPPVIGSFPLMLRLNLQIVCTVFRFPQKIMCGRGHFSAQHTDNTAE